MRDSLVGSALLAGEPDDHCVTVKIETGKNPALNKIDTETELSENRGILLYVVKAVNKFKHIPIFIVRLVRESRKSSVKTFKSVNYKDLSRIRNRRSTGNGTREGVSACIVGDHAEIYRSPLFRFESVTQHIADIDAVVEGKTVCACLHDIACCGIS